MDSTDKPQRPPPTMVGKYPILLPKYRRPGEPEHYRVSRARMDAPKREPPMRQVNFWFRTRYISADAAELGHSHPHLLGLNIRPSPVARFFHSCLDMLPAFVRSWASTLFPEWFLPSRVVLKAQKKSSDNDEQGVLQELFDTEVEAYNRLRPLQGTVVPRCYGQLRYDGSRALLLEYLGGASLTAPESATLTVEELSELMQPCYRALYAFGIHHDDPHPDNFQLVDGRIMALDLERVMFEVTDDQKAIWLTTNIGDLADRYRSVQYFLFHEGWLEGAD